MATPPDETGVVVQTTSKEDVLEDGTRVIQTTTTEIYPDGSKCNKTVTKRITSATTSEKNVGRPTVTIGLRKPSICCCFIPLGKKNDDGDDEEDEEGVKEEAKAEES